MALVQICWSVEHDHARVCHTFGTSVTLHYTTLHYTTLHYTTLHYTQTFTETETIHSVTETESGGDAA